MSNVAFASIATTETAAGHTSRHLSFVGTSAAPETDSRRANPFRFGSSLEEIDLRDAVSRSCCNASA
jgi:hypothetical protein